MNTADLASLMPKGDSGEAASLLPKIVELQSKLQQIEGIPSTLCAISDLRIVLFEINPK